jgi:hypothetical protein
VSGNLEGQLHHRHLADVCLSSVSESVGSLIGIAMAIHELVELETLAFSTVRYARCHGGGRTVDDSTRYPGSPGSHRWSERPPDPDTARCSPRGKVSPSTPRSHLDTGRVVDGSTVPLSHFGPSTSSSRARKSAGEYTGIRPDSWRRSLSPETSKDRERPASAIR